MTGQDILPELRSKLIGQSRKRLLIFLLISLTYVYYLNSIKLAHFETNISSSDQTNQDEERDLLMKIEREEHQKWQIKKPTNDHLISLIKQHQSIVHSHQSILPITAIIVISNLDRSSDDGNIILITSLLIKYSFIKEIIIWNDEISESGLDLTADDLLLEIQSYGFIDQTFLNEFTTTIRVLNSPGGLREMSYHIACSMSEYDTCYYNNLNSLNFNLDALYSKYIESNGESNLIIVNQASPEEYIYESNFEIDEPNGLIQTGIISELSRGSILSKTISIRYFHQLTTTILPPTPTTRSNKLTKMMINDLQLSIWNNRPCLKLISLDDNSFIRINKRKSKIELDSEFIKSSYQRLNDTLQTHDPFLIPKIYPKIMIKNNKNMMMIKTLKYEIGLISSKTKNKNDDDERFLLFFNDEFFSKNKKEKEEDKDLIERLKKIYSLIDYNLDSCFGFKSIGSLNKDNHLGLNLIQPKKIEMIKIKGILNFKKFKLEVLDFKSNSKWEFEKIKLIEIHQDLNELNTYTFKLNQFSNQQEQEKQEEEDDDLKVKKIRIVYNEFDHNLYNDFFLNDHHRNNNNWVKDDYNKNNVDVDQKICGWILDDLII